MAKIKLTSLTIRKFDSEKRFQSTNSVQFLYYVLTENVFVLVCCERPT